MQILSASLEDYLEIIYNKSKTSKILSLVKGNPAQVKDSFKVQGGPVGFTVLKQG